MPSKRSLGLKMLAMNLACLLCAATLGIGAFYAQERFTSIIDANELNTKAIRNHTLADMHHDGLKGALYRVLYATTSDRAQIADALKDLDDQARSLDEKIAANDALPLAGDVKAALKPVIEPFRDYVARSRAIAALAASDDRAGVLRALPAFEQLFDDLARLNGKVGDAIEQAIATKSREYDKLTRIMATLKWAIFVMLGALALGMTIVMRRRVIQPLAELSSSIRSLQNGDTSITLSKQRPQDELGEVFQALDTLRSHIEKDRATADQRALEQRERDAVREAVEGAVSHLQGGIESALNGIDETVSRLDQAAGTMRLASREATDVASYGSAAASSMTEVVQTVAAAGEELSMSTSEIANQIGRASGITSAAHHQARDTATRISDLHEAAVRIGQCVTLISGIAEQTNLLALNATIEAARAGEAGRGFGVVASEVKILATSTARATREIGAIVDDIQTMTGSSSEAIEQIRATIGELDRISMNIAGSMEQQQAATAEIARNAQRAATETERLVKTVLATEKSAKSAGNTADQLVAAGLELGGQSRQMHDEVKAFLESVRAAQKIKVG